MLSRAERGGRADVTWRYSTKTTVRSEVRDVLLTLVRPRTTQAAHKKKMNLISN